MKPIVETQASNIRPLFSKVLVKPLRNPEVISGVYIPEEYRQFCGLATVLKVGPGPRINGKIEPDLMMVREGNMVAVSPVAGSEIRVDGETCRLVDISDIQLVYHEEGI